MSNKYLIKHYVLAQQELNLQRKALVAQELGESFDYASGKVQGLELAAAIAGIEPRARDAWEQVKALQEAGITVALDKLDNICDACAFAKEPDPECAQLFVYKEFGPVTLKFEVASYAHGIQQAQWLINSGEAAIVEVVSPYRNVVKRFKAEGVL